MPKFRWSVGVVLVVAWVAALALSGHGGVGDRTPDVRPAADEGPAVSESVTPSYLPAGATLVQAIGNEPDARFRENHYQLAGAANANTIPASGLDDSNVLTAHTATTLTVTFVPGLSVVPDVPADPEFINVTPVEIGGVPAVLTTAKNGLGVQRIDWVDAAGYHIVMCERLSTVDGISGVPADELVKIAASLYT
jgi:hypothetical protein